MCLGSLFIYPSISNHLGETWDLQHHLGVQVSLVLITKAIHHFLIQGLQEVHHLHYPLVLLILMGV